MNGNIIMWWPQPPHGGFHTLGDPDMCRYTAKDDKPCFKDFQSFQTGATQFLETSRFGSKRVFFWARLGYSMLLFPFFRHYAKQPHSRKKIYVISAVLPSLGRRVCKLNKS